MGQWFPKPRRDSFPAFDVIHLGKCSRKILQEPKDQETVPTLNLGSCIWKLRFCIYELSPKTMAEISVGMCFFLNHFCNGDSLLVLGFDKKSDSQGLGKNMRTVTLLYHRLWFFEASNGTKRLFDCGSHRILSSKLPNPPSKFPNSADFWCGTGKPHFPEGFVHPGKFQQS